MSLIKLSMDANNLNYSCPGRVWSVTSRLETGKSLTFFYSVGGMKNVESMREEEFREVCVIRTYSNYIHRNSVLG